MISKRFLTLIASVAIATTALSGGTVALGSEGHDEEGGSARQFPLLPRLPGVDLAALSLDDVVLGTEAAPRDVPITMTEDFRYDPDIVVVAAGETVRFLIDNPTSAAHSILLGDLETQVDHEIEMAENEGGHEEGGEEEVEAGGLPGVLVLEAGESAEVTTTFESAGSMLMGCHRPGHWAAGMVGALVVLPVS